MYLPQSQKKELERLYNMLKAEYEYEYEEEFEKTARSILLSSNTILTVWIIWMLRRYESVWIHYSTLRFIQR